MSTFDWTIVVAYVLLCATIGLLVKRYVRHVADFTLAGRSVGTNMGVAAMTCTGMGLVAMTYTSELGFRNGFAGAIPGIIAGLASLMVGGTGFMIGPLRKARVITIPEMLERHYGKGVRWLAGLVVVLGGLLNMGIFLRLAGEFLVHATGLNPAYLQLTMIGLLVVAILYTVVGGMVAVVVTNYLAISRDRHQLLTVSALVSGQPRGPTLQRGFKRPIVRAWSSGGATRSSGMPPKPRRRRGQERRARGGRRSTGRPATAERRGVASRRQAARFAIRPGRHGRRHAEGAGDGQSAQSHGERRGRSDMARLAISLCVYCVGDVADRREPRAWRKDVATVKWMFRLNTFHPISSLCCPVCGPWAPTCFSARSAGCPKASAP